MKVGVDRVHESIDWGETPFVSKSPLAARNVEALEFLVYSLAMGNQNADRDGEMNTVPIELTVRHFSRIIYPGK